MLHVTQHQVAAKRQTPRAATWFQVAFLDDGGALASNGSSSAKAAENYGGTPDADAQLPGAADGNVVKEGRGAVPRDDKLCPRRTRNSDVTESWKPLCFSRYQSQRVSK